MNQAIFAWAFAVLASLGSFGCCEAPMEREETMTGGRRVCDLPEGTPATADGCCGRVLPCVDAFSEADLRDQCEAQGAETYPIACDEDARLPDGCVLLGADTLLDCTGEPLTLRVVCCASPPF